jgi:RND family efflux transporter MFP subunit
MKTFAKNMTTRGNIAALALLTAFSLAWAGCATSTAEKSQKMPPPEVEVTDVVQKNVTVSGDWVSTLDGYINASIQPQVSGYLVKQNYREGDVVHKGQVLFEIDPRTFQAALDQAQAQLAQSRAQLELAHINVKRDTPLAAQRAIAQSQLDTEIQQEAQYAAAVKASEAAVETAQLNLGWTKVRSLVDGIAGRAETQVGNLVNLSTVLTQVSQVNPIKVYFPISEQEYLGLANRAKSHGRPDLLSDADTVPLQLTLADGEVYPYKGKIVFVDRQVNTQTGTIRIAAAFPNPKNLLRPGQFGRIQAQTDLLQNALLVPQRAVSELQGGYNVFVVGSDNVAKVRPVKIGRQVNSLWIIQDGLKPGDRVITEGLAKVRDGVPVTPKSASPESAQAPAKGSEGQ